MNHKTREAPLAAAALLFSVLSGPVPAQTAAMCAGTSEALKWPMEHDATGAAPRNHRVLYESADVRILEVTVAPGERENLHHHRWPSVMVVDARPRYINYDQHGNEIPPAVQGSPELPVVARLPPQAEHAIENTDTRPFHAFRIEFKTLCQTQ